MSVGINTDITGDFPPEEGFPELNIEGALTDELKLLQVKRIVSCNMSTGSCLVINMYMYLLSPGGHSSDGRALTA